MKKIYLHFKIHGFREGLENTLLDFTKWFCQADEIIVKYKKGRFYSQKS